MLELFRMDAVGQIQALNDGLLALERAPTAAGELEACMRAAHSLKGAARIVGLTAGVSVAHAMEDCFVAAQRGTITLRREQIDVLLDGADLLNRIAATPEADVDRWTGEKREEVDGYLATLAAVLAERNGTAPSENGGATISIPALPEPSTPAGIEPRGDSERALQVTAEHLNRLLAVAGESLVESRWATPFAASLLRLKRLQHDMGNAVDVLREALPTRSLDERVQSALEDVRRRTNELHGLLAERLAEVETFDRRSTNLAQRLYDEALACRMRPFADGVRAFPRMVRDLAHALGKEARLEIVGETTQLDRDILERLDAPLGHLLRNAIDHGIESPQERRAAGKAVEGVVRLEARHTAGMLQVVVSDDGRGIMPERLRHAVVGRKLTNAETAEKLSEAELLEFLFLPGFSMKGVVTEISGRGVGLDVVQNAVKQVRGTIRVAAEPGKGARFQLLLPLSLSVMRTLIVEVGGERYAFPLAYIVRTVRLPRSEIASSEGRQFFTLAGRSVGLVGAHQILRGGEGTPPGEELAVVVVGTATEVYGLVADRFLGERDLVVQTLDPRLGKVKDIAAGALMEDGSPVLIVDVDDLLRSVEKLVATGQLTKMQRGEAAARARKRVLVVDDSLTVREVERKLLDNAGYDVEVAVDGMDGLNAVRSGRFDLLVTDVDMPRLDGIELCTLVKNDASLKGLPVMIVSYKDREEDRRRGLEAGADYYLTKGSFHDETLLQAVVDLVGEAGP
jgi:two-component system, chemotaxis family, sensor histidine kinase and response regulator WspE